MATALHARAAPAADAAAAQRLEWAALLHEIGFSVSHIGFHKHGAYILENADMPGFSAQEQRDLALLVLGCRGGLDEDGAGRLADARFRARLLGAAARRAVPPCAATDRRAAGRTQGRRARSASRVPARWLKAHPLTAYLLAKEREEWTGEGYPFSLA